MKKPAAARKTQPQTLILASPPADLGAELDMQDAADDLENVLGELGASDAGGSVKIYRMNPKDRTDRVFVDDLALKEFSLKGTREKYGGGLYNFLIYVPQRDRDGNPLGGRVKLAGNKTIAIDGLPKIPRDEPAPAAAAATPPASSPENQLLMAFVRAQEQSEARMTRLIEAIAAKPAAGMQLEDTLRILTLFKQSGLMGAPTPAADPAAMMRESIGLAKSFAELAAGARRGDEDDGDEPIGEGGGGQRVLWKLAEKFMDNFAMLNPGAVTQAGAPAAGEIPAAAPALEHQPQLTVIEGGPAAPASVPAAAATEEADMQTSLIKMALSKAIDHAQRNTPVAEFAPTVIDFVPPALLDTLYEDDWYENLCALEPRARLNPAWFQQLRAEIIRLEPPEEA